MTEAEITATAAKIRELGLPDFLNRWIALTPEAHAEHEAAKREIMEGKMKPGSKEQQLRAMRAGTEDFDKAQLGRDVHKPRAGTKDPPKGSAKVAPAEAAKAAQPAEEKESPEVRSGPKKRASATRTAVRGKTSAASDKSPRAVGEFIVAGGDGGVAMADLEKEFKMGAHPLRSKIHAAKHKLGFTIEYDHEAKRYTGKAPRRAA